MAILKRLTRDEITSTFTHTGIYAGIVPVYVILDELEDGKFVPEIPMYECNWVPSWTLGLVNTVWGLLTLFYPHAPPLYITGDIK